MGQMELETEEVTTNMTTANSRDEGFDDQI